MDLQEQLLEARKEYLDLLRADVLGPGSECSLPDAEHEVISGNPVDRYSTGILFPQGNRIDLENDEAIIKRDDSDSEVRDDEDDDEADDESDDGTKSQKEQEEVITDLNSIKKGEDFNDAIDEDINMSAQYMPSSMGMMFLIDTDVEEINGKLQFAMYEKVKVCEDCKAIYFPSRDDFVFPAILSKNFDYDLQTGVISLKLPINKNEIRELIEKASVHEAERFRLKQALYQVVNMFENGHKRVPMEYDFRISFNEKGLYESKNGEIEKKELKISAMKKEVAGGKQSIVIMLVNTAEGGQDCNRCVFQPKMTIDTNNNKFRFIDSSSAMTMRKMNEEEQNLALLYRNKHNYGSGLGVSVDWEIDETGSGWLCTEYLPMEEVPATDFNLGENDLLKNSDLSMKLLSDLDETPREKKIEILSNLVELYGEWIADLKKTLATLDKRFQAAAEINIQKCEMAQGRMRKGLEILAKSDVAYNAFILANRAMFMQRVHIRLKAQFAAEEDCLPGNMNIAKRIREMNYYEESDISCYWRPFQIAFILMDIESITNDESPDRKVMDLIWFPTGGGKTEAYLGLTAFTIFYRRLAYADASSGTTVMMRYTLRLLTAQQFERASTLICACEYIRQDGRKNQAKYPKYDLGEEPITIGLWIGSNHVPNDNKVAKECVDKLYAVNSINMLENEKERNARFQVLNCPWCGTKMTKQVEDKKIVGEWGYRISGGHFCMNCPNYDCDFARELPIQVVDEELYRKPPTLLFGTVDKFAMLTWREETGSFFAVGTKNRAPELIVQDELHLISGSLGTIIGLYEMAIDAMCGQKGVLAKIVASTATIRRAEEQCSNLYNRDVAQFPASGLDADDSFFSKVKRIDYAKGDFGRMYVGIIPTGKLRARVEARVMASLLQRIKMMDLPDEVRDKYWTFTAYYNSLRDLGKAASLVGDNVKRDIRALANRLLAQERFIYQADELTSRVNTTKLNTTLNKLERVSYQSFKEGEKRTEYPIGVLLATNMISVGIDVSRLNVMMLVGQPKTTSEYIQASSRVGREYPGIVINQYDTTRSRDRSHYEHFKSYHESFYRYVEPTSVTPFSSAALERALHAVLVALFRQQETGIAGEKDAGGFDKVEYAEILDRIKNCYLDRVKEINNRGKSGVLIDVDEVTREIDGFFDYWDERARSCRESEIPRMLRYGRGTLGSNMATVENDYLLKTYESSDRILAKPTLTSMRNVDKAVSGYLIDWKEEK